MFATFHDIFIVLGCWSLFQWEFSLTVLAAVLAIMGYSVNDTVVVFDRIRENFKKTRSDDVAAIMDNAKTATLSRTIITSGATQLMVLAMLFLGGEVLYGFALALTIGIVVGTYSSVLVASPIVMWLGVSRQDFIKPVKPESGAMV
jgi:preprotein translocase subunit SecF